MSYFGHLLQILFILFVPVQEKSSDMPYNLITHPSVDQNKQFSYLPVQTSEIKTASNDNAKYLDNLAYE